MRETPNERLARTVRREHWMGTSVLVFEEGTVSGGCDEDGLVVEEARNKRLFGRPKRFYLGSGQGQARTATTADKQKPFDAP